MSEQEFPKQVVVMRKDLKMRRGKEMAQAGHAFMKDLLDVYCNRHSLVLDREQIEYYFGIFRKITLYTESEQQLIEIYDEAQSKGLRVHMIIDSGLTEFNGVPTKTCLCIGPHYDSKIDPITRPRNLKLA